jgi:hypothetical protein
VMGKRTKGALSSGGRCVQGGFVKFSAVKRELNRSRRRAHRRFRLAGKVPRDSKETRSADEMCAGHYGANHSSPACKSTRKTLTL